MQIVNILTKLHHFTKNHKLLSIIFSLFGRTRFYLLTKVNRQRTILNLSRDSLLRKHQIMHQRQVTKCALGDVDNPSITKDVFYRSGPSGQGRRKSDMKICRFVLWPRAIQRVFRSQVTWLRSKVDGPKGRNFHHPDSDRSLWPKTVHFRLDPYSANLGKLSPIFTPR